MKASLKMENRKNSEQKSPNYYDLSSSEKQSSAAKAGPPVQ